MNGPELPQACPEPLIAFARERLLAQLEEHEKDKRPLYLRWLIRRPLFPLLPTMFANVRQFSDCNFADRKCVGTVVTCWIVSQTKVFGEAPAPKAGVQAPSPAVVNYIRTLLVDFAVAPTGRECVIVETDLEGRIQRAAYELPSGIHGSKVGPVIGSVVEDRTVRNWRKGDIP